MRELGTYKCRPNESSKKDGECFHKSFWKAKDASKVTDKQ